MRRLALCLALMGAAASCSSPSSSHSATSALQAAAHSTAQARSLTLSFLDNVQVNYQSPDRVEQIEHGQTSIVPSGHPRGTPATSWTGLETITQIFVDNRYFEADTINGDTPTFSVAAAQACSIYQNAAQYILTVLRTMAAGATATRSGDAYRFRVPNAKGLIPHSGVATLSGGFVRSLAFTSKAARPGWTITSVNRSRHPARQPQ